MDTEHPSPRYSGIDAWAPSDALDAMIEAHFSALAAVRAARPSIQAAAMAMAERLGEDGRIVYAGAGTSGRLAVQDGAELMPTFGWPPERLVLLMAGGQRALAHAVEGAEDHKERADDAIRKHAVGEADAMIAVAASGTTPFTLACLRNAKSRGALTIAIANNPGTPLLGESDHPILLDTGAEPIAGSTRMKAGTAQRVVLSLLSSLVMIQLGRVYNGLMVEVQPTNKKLAQRCEAILQQLSGKSVSEARTALGRANGNLKAALLILNGCDPNEAQQALAVSGGRLREAMQAARRKR